MSVLMPNVQAAGAAAAVLALLACEPAAAQSDACMNLRCFSDSQVRDFRAVDDDTLVIYVGPERCPFLVNVQGSYCDVKYLPDIDFFHERNRRFNNRSENSGRSAMNDRVSRRVFGRRNGANGALDIDRGDGFTRNDRICLNEAGQYALETFGFSPYFLGDIPQGVAECPVRNVEKLTDDDLIEIYIEDGVAPPPPLGNGTISRAEREPGAEE